MKIDHQKTNQSIESNQYQLVNWYWLVLANRWSINSHIKLSANYIDSHHLLLITFSVIDENRWKVIDFQYRSINCYRLISTGIDFWSIDKFIDWVCQEELDTYVSSCNLCCRLSISGRKAPRKPSESNSATSTCGFSSNVCLARVLSLSGGDSDILKLFLPVEP